jgi:hypothetical protein
MVEREMVEREMVEREMERERERDGGEREGDGGARAHCRWPAVLLHAANLHKAASCCRCGG